MKNKELLTYWYENFCCDFGVFSEPIPDDFVKGFFLIRREEFEIISMAANLVHERCMDRLVNAYPEILSKRSLTTFDIA